MARRPHGIPAAKPIFALLLSPLEDLDEDPNVEGDDDGEEVKLDRDGDDDRIDDSTRDSAPTTEETGLVTTIAVVLAAPRYIIDSGIPSVNMLFAVKYLY